jgi:hypothetical protein
MTIQLINPADLPAQATYTQVVVAAGTTHGVHRRPGT